MKFIGSIVSTCIILSMCYACSGQKEEMIPEDFIKIETEFLSTDMTDDAKEKATKKYGYTPEQFDAFAEKVENDLELKTKLGEIRLNMQQQKQSE
jgi:hypothetical protein